MNATDIQKLVRQGEGQRLEFKRSLAELETAVRAIAAFANSEGGVVLLGVRDSGEIIGIEVGGQTKVRLSTMITGVTDPVIYPSVEIISVAEKTVIAIKVDVSENRPHLCKGRAYKRVGATDAQLSRDEYEKLLLARATAVYDRQPISSARFADLSEERIHWYLKQRAEKRGIAIPDRPLSDLMIGLSAAVNQAGEISPTRAGMLCFGKKPQESIPHSHVRIARFKGFSTTHFIDRADLYGTLPELIDAAEQFTRRNTRLAAKIVGFRRREVTEYPFEAIREAICRLC
ncbi:MAG: helix-turn-helix domain-containing protein [bacterium]